MKKVYSLLLILFLFISGAKADEGMWLPYYLKNMIYDDMQKTGLKLTPEEIYSINHSSLKDAIIQFGGGCTGEVVSNQGLVFTNHHCGYASIQSLSSVEHNYLSNGFWAYKKQDELPCPGLTVKFLVKVEDVTSEVLRSVNKGTGEKDRMNAIQKEIIQIQNKAAEKGKYDTRVVPFFAGNEYYLFVYEVYRDIRLVGTPPESVGKFGGDTDNWMWPRHTGDFSIFRIYASPDGKPAAYSPTNVPMKPKHFLPVSIKGVNKGDYAMVMGYPGRTNRYKTSWGIHLSTDITNPAVVSVRDKKLSIMREFMSTDKAVRIMYASKYAGISNYWKYYIGQTRGLKRMNSAEGKEQIEKEFDTWINADATRKEQYGNVLPNFAEAYKIIDQYALSKEYTAEALLGTEAVKLAGTFNKYMESIKDHPDDPTKTSNLIQYAKDDFFKNYYEPLDQKTLGCMLELFYKNIPADQQFPLIKEIYKKYKGDFQKYAAEAFAKTNFSKEDKFLGLVDKPTKKALDKDPIFVLFQAVKAYDKMLSEKIEAGNELLSTASRLYLKGLRKMNPNKKFYPDANFTMRLSYGKVMDYDAADAVHYKFYTTLKGVIEKEDSTNDEFIVPKKLKDLYYAKDFGQYANKDGELVVAFTTNNDITGGNSGSPVMNSNGELIGLAFDGNWEAMSGDVAFEPSLQRCICVDVRYVLFIIDKYAGARNLIDELQLER